MAGVSEARVVPGSVSATQERDGGLINGNSGDVQLVVEDERPDFDANEDVLGGEEWVPTEGWVVGDGERRSFKAAGEDGKAEVAKLDLTVERL